MFICVKKIGTYEYLLENAREGGRHVHRVIKALGRREEVEASGLIDGLIASAARHSRRSIVLSSFYRPRFVVAADNKWFTRLVVVAAINEALDKLDLKFPRADKKARVALISARTQLKSER
jgi:hypothetical protein